MIRCAADEYYRHRINYFRAADFVMEHNKPSAPKNNAVLCIYSALALLMGEYQLGPSSL
jgi:hypothetical protein